MGLLDLSCHRQHCSVENYLMEKFETKALTIFYKIKQIANEANYIALKKFYNIVIKK